MLSGADLMEWSAFEQLHGPLLITERIDAAAASICALIANVMGAGKKRYQPSDFMPRWGGEVAQSPEEMIAIVRSFQKKEE